MEYLYIVLNWIMEGCYGLVHHYGWAIILFTFCSKIVLLPVTLWTYFNSIKMIRIQPEINLIKVKYYGQKDVIAEEEAAIQKKQGYHPILSSAPLIIQIVLLIGVVGVIRQGTADPSIDMNWGPINLGAVPAQEGVRLIWAPIVAGLSAWLLCIVQNAENVLQAEQSKYTKYGTMALSVGISLYLGWFVSVGTALYWVSSNLLSIVQQLLLNAIIRPRRYVDYEKLEDSRKQLAEIQGIGGTEKDQLYSAKRKKERKDYKQFFSVVNKHLVFYSESSGFYKYFKGYIEYILAHTNITIHYITSDFQDQIFELEKENPQIRAYYIGENRLITLMMKMDADVVVMTMPDLENYHIKRSMVRKDIEYIFVQHDMNSHSMLMRKGCVDHFDTIFCTGPHQLEEVRATEEVYHLPPKKLLEIGYPLIDEIRAGFQEIPQSVNARKKILIAPSWQDDNIIDSCLEEILDQLRTRDYEVIVRPHPQEVRLKKAYMEELKNKYQDSNIVIQTDFSSNSPVMEADILITDWSGISWEYAFTTYRPVLFIDTPAKIMNPDYKEIPLTPINISLRDKIGKNLKPDEISQKLLPVLDELLEQRESYREQNKRLAEQYIYHLGSSAETGAAYIIQSVKEKAGKRGK